MHPKHCVPLDAWLLKIASYLRMSNVAFKTELGSMSIFNAMPNFWKAWTLELQEEVVCKIDGLTKASSDPGNYVFRCKDNLTALWAYMPVATLQQLWVAYTAAKQDDCLITMTTSQLLAGVTAAVATEESDQNA
jgi:hypothetical protein